MFYPGPAGAGLRLACSGTLAGGGRGGAGAGGPQNSVSRRTRSAVAEGRQAWSGGNAVPNCPGAAFARPRRLRNERHKSGCGPPVLAELGWWRGTPGNSVRWGRSILVGNAVFATDHRLDAADAK